MKKRICFVIPILCLLCGCIRQNPTFGGPLPGRSEITAMKENGNVKEDPANQWGKGYDLPIAVSERKEAADACKTVLELISDIYAQADKGNAVNTVLDDRTIDKMQERIKENGYPVTMRKAYAAVENYKKVEDFLINCQKEKAGSAVLYELHSDGSIGRDKFMFDGKDMYVLSASATLNNRNTCELYNISYARIKEWKYTETGWFGYAVCVPEPPEVTEIVNESRLIRVRPMDEKLRELSEKYVQDLGYQGNNLLCSNWDTEHMEELDYNGLYEYLYEMKYQKKFPTNDYFDGIPREEFERLIMEYLPVTAEQLQSWAVFDKEKQVYASERSGCLNYAPTYFGTSLPEVTGTRENADGTVTLTVAAVCDMLLCDNAVITHELTVKFADDGSFQYLGNKILNDGIKKIPEYQYRIRKE